jgi:hypothetical protein
VICNEKELVITELKEKVVVLSSRNMQLEIQVKDLNSHNMLVKILSAIVLLRFDCIIGNFMMYFNRLNLDSPSTSNIFYYLTAFYCIEQCEEIC